MIIIQIILIISLISFSLNFEEEDDIRYSQGSMFPPKKECPYKFCSKGYDYNRCENKYYPELEKFCRICECRKSASLTNTFGDRIVRGDDDLLEDDDFQLSQGSMFPPKKECPFKFCSKGYDYNRCENKYYPELEKFCRICECRKSASLTNTFGDRIVRGDDDDIQLSQGSMFPPKKECPFKFCSKGYDYNRCENKYYSELGKFCRICECRRSASLPNTFGDRIVRGDEDFEMY